MLIYRFSSLTWAW